MPMTITLKIRYWFLKIIKIYRNEIIL